MRVRGVGGSEHCCLLNKENGGKPAAQSSYTLRELEFNSPPADSPGPHSPFRCEDRKSRESSAVILQGFSSEDGLRLSRDLAFIRWAVHC